MIYFIRHGQTDWNKLKVMQGQVDIPLNENGINQAKEVGKNLQGITFDYVYCSPFLRARQTLENLGIEIDSEKISFDERLKERSYGDFEGKPRDSFDYDKCWYHSLSLTTGNIEPVNKFFDRVANLIKEIEKQHKGKNVLIVAHAGISRAFKFYFDGLKDEDISSFLPNNGEILKFKL